MSENVLMDIEPAEVLSFFGEILQIPHPSGNEGKLSDYLVSFANERGLEVHRDSANNVVIKKNATNGMENKAGVILQSHIDMVAVADKDVDIDFDKDSIKAYVDGDLIKAKGTTLGADDGIGAAMILAVLDSKEIAHPNIEAVFTTSEEVGLDGAKALDISLLKNKRMINIDSEDENELVIGCAGGCRAGITYEYKTKKVRGHIVEITLEGLKGGHSGIEIDKNHPNANILMGRILYELDESVDFALVSLEGGLRDNAITTSCVARIVIGKDNANLLKNKLQELEMILAKEYSATEPDFRITYNRVAKDTVNVLTYKEFYRLMYLINMAPNGVLKMSQHMQGMVNTSSNLGVLSVKDKCVDAGFCLRSNEDTSREWLKKQFEMLAAALGAQLTIEGEYPAWENAGVSDFAKNIAGEYKRLTGNEMKILCIHAGLECALFYKKIQGLDAVSIGPNLTGAHTTEEAVSIKSIGVLWKLLKNILAS